LSGAGDNGAATAALSESLEREGFVIFDSGVPEETIDRARADADSQIYPESTLAETIRRGRRAVFGKHTTVSARTERRVQDAWVVSPSVKAIAEDPTVLAVLEDLYGRPPIPWQTLNFRIGSEQAAHSDAMYFNSDPPGFMCGVWLALEDIDETCGPVVYYPGSHRLPELTAKDVKEATGKTEGPMDGPTYEAYLMDLVNEAGIEPAYATLAKGQALIWASNLVHGGSPQTDRTRSRWSQVTHYIFEGVRLWKPFLTEGEKVYFEPALIR
jgi:ectoine hydroxylase-related dioxygenase (phytanoyl-CoA dioxygenase family)